DAAVLALVKVGPLVGYERDEEAELRDLNGDGLDIHTVEAVLDEVELATVVVLVLLEVPLDSSDGRVTRRGVRDLRRPLDLEPLPLLVVRVQFVDDVYELLEDAHREGTRSAGGVEDLARV